MLWGRKEAQEAALGQAVLVALHQVVPVVSNIPEELPARGMLQTALVVGVVGVRQGHQVRVQMVAPLFSMPTPEVAEVVQVAGRLVGMRPVIL